MDYSFINAQGDVVSQPPAAVSDDQTYQDILEKDVLELMGAKDMAEDKKQNLYSKILETVQNRAIARISDQLSEQDFVQWQQVAESKDQQKMQDFLKSHDIDLSKIMLQEALVYKIELTELSQPIRKASK